jgi:hypothetical protein
MKQLQVLILFLLTILTQTTFGQEKKTEQELKDYLQHLKATNVDTVLIVKSGCKGCETKYVDYPKAIDSGQSIYVVTQQKGKFIITMFDDVHLQKSFGIDTCSLFDFVFKNRILLQEKTEFYKTEIPKIKSKDGFYPPRKIHYRYEELSIKTPSFNYIFEIINNNEDNYGFKRDNENWFILTSEIIKKVYNYSFIKEGVRQHRRVEN